MLDLLAKLLARFDMIRKTADISQERNYMTTEDKTFENVASAINKAVAADEVHVPLLTTFNVQLEASVKEIERRTLTCFSGDHSQDYDSLMCSVHSTYTTEENHNCLGCNFDDLIRQLHDYLSMVTNQKIQYPNQIPHVYSIYFLLLNGLWERINNIFRLLGVPDSYKNNRFHAFLQIRRWANFFKHPGSFTYIVHHPAITIDGSRNERKHEYKDQLDLADEHAQLLYINSDFVWTNYSAEKESKALQNSFKKHKTSTVIVLPNLEQTTLEICSCLEHFVDLISNNPIYVEILRDTSSLIDQFQEDEEE